MRRSKPSKEELVCLIEKHTHITGVAAELGVPYNTAKYWLNSSGVKLAPSCMTIYEELRSVKMSAKQKQVVIGSILGDGCLIKQKASKNARLQIGHCGKQLGYLKWKAEILSPFVKNLTPTLAEAPGKKMVCGKECNTSGYYLINTISHPDITSYYSSCYVGGHKRAPSLLADQIDILGFAIWLADDGSFSARGDCKVALKGSIATCCFSKDEHLILASIVKRFFGGNVCVSESKSGYVMYLSGTKELNKLLDMVTGVLTPLIHYKFVPQRLLVQPLKGEDIV